MSERHERLRAALEALANRQERADRFHLPTIQREHNARHREHLAEFWGRRRELAEVQRTSTRAMRFMREERRAA